MSEALPIFSSRRATLRTSRPSCASCRGYAAALDRLGSNLLVRDGGIRGAVVATHGALGPSNA